MNANTIVVGIDIGNVIVGSDTDAPDLFFTKKYLETPPINGAFESIAGFTRKFGAQNVHLVSKCGPSVEGKSRKWLRVKEFHEQTGVPPEQVHFCRERREKRGICEYIGATHFIDDRWTVLLHLVDLPRMRAMYLFAPSPDERAAFEKVAIDAPVTVVNGWAEIVVA